MSKHTRGLWEFDADRDEMHVHVQGGIIASIFTPDDSPCFCPETDEESDKVWEECAANGRLVAAAPELAEALQATAEALEMALGRLGVCGQGDGADHRADSESFGGTAALTQARAALKKAGVQ